MRDVIWNAVRSKVPEGTVLPWWALAVRGVLYPLDFFYWRMGQTTGYQFENDTWLINGVVYSGESLRWLAKAQGETYRVTRTGETVTLERVHNAGEMACMQIDHDKAVKSDELYNVARQLTDSGFTDVDEYIRRRCQDCGINFPPQQKNGQVSAVTQRKING